MTGVKILKKHACVLRHVWFVTRGRSAIAPCPGTLSGKNIEILVVSSWGLPNLVDQIDALGISCIGSGFFTQWATGIPWKYCRFLFYSSHLRLWDTAYLWILLPVLLIPNKIQRNAQIVIIDSVFRQMRWNWSFRWQTVMQHVSISLS